MGGKEKKRGRKREGGIKKKGYGKYFTPEGSYR